MLSAKRTARGLVDPGWVGVIAGVPFRRIVFGSEEAEVDVLGEDRPADEDFVFSCRPSAGRSNCQSIPCCFLSLAKDSLRASKSSFDLAILSGWWYNTACRS